MEHLHTLAALPPSLRYALFSALVFVEGPTATVVGGVLAASGGFSFKGAFVVAVLTNLAADVFWYQVGAWIKRSGRWFQKIEQRYPYLPALEEYIRKRAVGFVLLAKFTFNGVPALLAAGIARVPWRKILGAVLLGETLWIALLLGVGYFLWTRSGALAMSVRVAGVIGMLVFGAWVIHKVRQVARRAFESGEMSM